MIFKEYPPAPKLVEVFERHSPDVKIVRTLVAEDKLFLVRVIETLDGKEGDQQFRHLSVGVIVLPGSTRLPRTHEIHAAAKAAGFDISKCEQMIRSGLVHLYCEVGK